MTRKKIGKNRLDKFYKLAKEQGYRARSAFKLIQLDAKYNILEKVHSAIDLCAAPGGWLQVCTKKNIKTIIGIDLVPIKPINNVITLKCDITTETCKKELIRILGDKKVDLILHDGAPNVGTDWDQDSYAQNELVLHSLRLGSEFLIDGGSFLTKVFRSKDYCKLLYVFNELFDEVDATKPLSSREESAEIFVFCKGFKSERVKNHLFEPEIIFDDENIKERYNKVVKISLTDFLNSSTPAEDLNTIDRIDFHKEEKELQGHLDDELKQQFKDIKLIDEVDKKKILKWRNNLIEKLENEEVKLSNYKIQRKEIDLNIDPKILTDEEKLIKIEEELKKYEKMQKKKERKIKQKKIVPLPKNDFFNDKIFDSYYKNKEEEVVEISEQEECIECSDSLEIEEDELRCAIKLKEDEEAFIEDTIDKYCTNDTSKLPRKIVEEDFKEQSMGRIVKCKKEEEALLRRRRKANKKAQRIIEQKQKNQEDDEESGEEDNSRKIRRSVYKKSKNKKELLLLIKDLAKLKYLKAKEK